MTGNASFGLALTSGNKDTSSINAGYEVKYDPQTGNVFKSAGMLLTGKTDGESTVEQYQLTFRDEYSLNPRAFVFGDFRYLHDKFKGIDYLLSPTGGIGYKVLDLDATKVAVSAGIGLVSEQDHGLELHTTGAVTADEKLTHQLSKTATVSQGFTALWKTSGFGDALYSISASLAAAITEQAQLKVEVLDSYKTKPPESFPNKNGLTVLMAIVYKF